MNPALKFPIAVIIVAATIGSLLTAFHRQLVWERIDGDQLFWSARLTTSRYVCAMDGPATGSSMDGAT
jgi:hypothetical protein